MRLVVLALPAGDFIHRFDDSLDLVLRRITGTPQAHQAIGGLTEALGNGLGVEVAVRGEDALARKIIANLGRRDSDDDKGNRRRPWR
jgi:hypothetical protein